MENIKQKIKDKNKEINQILETRTMSVSKLIEYMHKEFDREGVAKKCFEKEISKPTNTNNDCHSNSENTCIDSSWRFGLDNY